MPKAETRKSVQKKESRAVSFVIWTKFVTNCNSKRFLHDSINFRLIRRIWWNLFSYLGVTCEVARIDEEIAMLDKAKSWADDAMTDLNPEAGLGDTDTGRTPLHKAAAKGFMNVSWIIHSVLVLFKFDDGTVFFFFDSADGSACDTMLRWSRCWRQRRLDPSSFSCVSRPERCGCIFDNLGSVAYNQKQKS